MKRLFLVAGCWLLVSCSFGQTVTQRLQKAFQQFEATPSLKHAISSLYVIDAKPGKLFLIKIQDWLAPASTKKLLLQLLLLSCWGRIIGIRQNWVMMENRGQRFVWRPLHLRNGDPTLGSNRYNSTREE